MIDRATFDRRLRAWLDGALAPAEAAEMAAYCRDDADARLVADAERAFDRRIRAALVADDEAAARSVVAAALARARSAGEVAERRGQGGVGPVRATAHESGGRSSGGRLLSMTPPAAAAAAAAADARPSDAAPSPRASLRLSPRPRRWAGLAAAAALLVGFAWYACIPPFECGLLQAMEAASRAPAAGVGELRGDACTVVRADWACGCEIKRTTHPVAGGTAALLLCPTDGHLPSFRRERTIDGRRWWVARENARTIVAFEDPGAAGIWCFVAEADEATLLAAAEAFRRELPRASK